MDSSFGNYLQILIIGAKSKRVFLHLYLNAYGNTEIADFAHETFLVF